MLSQAEHGTDSSAVVLTDSQPLAQAILEQLGQPARNAPARRRGLAVAQAVQPHHRGWEHGRCDPTGRTSSPRSISKSSVETKSRQIAERITNAGAVFIGPYTPVAVGDYWAGPSHTLPTGSRARFSSALTSNDFVKSISLIEYTADQLAAAADDIIRLAADRGPRRPRPQRANPSAAVTLKSPNRAARCSASRTARGRGPGSDPIAARQDIQSTSVTEASPPGPAARRSGTRTNPPSSPWPTTGRHTGRRHAAIEPSRNSGFSAEVESMNDHGQQSHREEEDRPGQQRPEDRDPLCPPGAGRGPEVAQEDIDRDQVRNPRPEAVQIVHVEDLGCPRAPWALS